MTAKKKAAKKVATKRPPRQVWFTFDPVLGKLVEHFGTKTDAENAVLRCAVVGPYVLAERARQK